MSTDNIDIRVREDGSRVVSRNLDAVATTAESADRSIKELTRSLKQVGSGTSLQWLRDNIQQIDSFSSSMVQRFGANLSQYRSTLMKHFEMISREAKATASSIKSQMESITSTPIGLDAMGKYYRQLEEEHKKFIQGAVARLTEQEVAEEKSSSNRLSAALKLIAEKQKSELSYTNWWNRELEKRLKLDEQFTTQAVKNLKTQEDADKASSQLRLRNATASIDQRMKAEEAYTAWWSAELRKRDTASAASTLRTSEQRSGMQAVTAERLDRSLIANAPGTSQMAQYYAAQAETNLGAKTALQNAEVQAMQRQMAMYSLLLPMVEREIALTTASEQSHARHVQALNNTRTAHNDLGQSVQNSAKNQVAWNIAANDGHAIARGLSGTLGTLWMTYGSLLPLLAGAALGAGFSQAAKAGSEFSYQLRFVQALGDETTQSMAMLNEEALNLAKNSIYGPVELANGFRILAQAGLNAAQSLAVIPHVMNLATVGEMKMEDAALTLVGVLNAFNLGTDKASHVGDVFAKAAAVSQTSVKDMTEAMKYASTVASQYHVSLEDTATALAVLAKNNIVGTSAGTAFRNMLKELYTPSKEAAAYMEKLQLKTSDANGKVFDFAKILYDLRGKLVGLKEIDQIDVIKKVFGERGEKEAVAILQLVRKEWDKLHDSIANSDGFMSKVADQLNSEAKSKWKMALNTLQVELIKVFQEMEVQFLNLADNLKNLFESPEFKQGVKSVVTGMVTVANAAVTLTPLLLDLAKAWAVYKAAQLGAGIASLAMSGASAFMSFAGSLAAASGAMGPTAAGVTTMGTLLRMIPHPLTIIAGLLVGGVTAWALWGNSAEDAATRSKTALDEVAKQAAATGKLELEIARENLAAAQDKYYSSGMKASSPERAEFSRWEAIVQQLEAKEARIKARIDAATKPASGLPAGSDTFTPPNPHEALQVFRNNLDSELALIEQNSKYEVQAIERKYKNLQIAEVDSIQQTSAVKIQALQAEITKYLEASTKTKDVSDSNKYINKAKGLANEIRLIQEASDDKIVSAKLNHAKVMNDIDKAYARQALSEEDKFIAAYADKWTTTLTQLGLEANSDNNEIAEGASKAMSKLQDAFAAGRLRAQMKDQMSEMRLAMTDIETVIKEYESEAERDGGWIARILGANSVDATIQKMLQKLGPQLADIREKLALNPDDKELVQTYSQLQKEFNKYANYVQPVWKDVVKNIDSTFHEGFAKMFEKGKTDWSAFGKSLAAKFKTTVVDAIYQMLARPLILNVVASISGALGMPGMANAAQGNGSGFNINGQNGALLKAGAQYLGDTYAPGFGTGMGLNTTQAAAASNAYNVAGYQAMEVGPSQEAAQYFATADNISNGSSFAGGAMGTIGGAIAAYQFAQKYGAIGGMIGGAGSIALGGAVGGALGIGSAGAAAAAAGGGIAGVGAGAMAALSAIPVWGWVAMAAVAILGSLAGKGGAPKLNINSGFGINGSAVTDSPLDNGTTAYGGGQNELKNAITTPAVMAVISQYAEKAAYDVKFGGHLNLKGSSSNQQYAYVTMNGQQLYHHFQESGKGIDDFNNWAAQEAPRVQLALMVGAFRNAGKDISDIANSVIGTDTDLTDVISKMDSNAVGQAIQNISGLIATFETLKSVVTQNVTGQITTSLATMFGGFQNLQTALTSYYTNYFSDEEKKTRQTADLNKQFQALNLTMPTSREGFRKIVESLDLTTDSGAKTFAGLMQLQGAFASLVEATTNASEELVDQAGKRDREIQIIELLGNGTAAIAARRQLELSKLDSVNRALQEHIYTLEDQNAAIDGAKSALKDAYDQESSSLKQLIDRSKDAAKSFRDLATNMLVGDQSPLSPTDQYAEIKRQFESTFNAAMSGDPDAQGKLSEVAQHFLEVSKSYNASSQQYTTDFNRVQDVLQKAAQSADTQANVAQQSLTQLNATVNGLLQVNTSVLSVRDAVNNLITALNAKAATAPAASIAASGSTQYAQNAVQAAQNANGAASSAAQLQLANAQLQSYGAQYGGNAYYLVSGVNDYSAKLKTASKYAQSTGASVDSAFQTVTGHSQAYWQEVQRQFDAGLHPTTTSIPGFATGGVFTNGIVSQPTLFNMAQMGEGADPEAIVPLVRTSRGLGVRSVGGGDDGVAEMIALLAEEVRQMREEVIVELKAANGQRGAAAMATLERLNDVATGLEDTRKAIRSKS